METAFPQNLHTRKLGEIAVFYAVEYENKNKFSQKRAMDCCIQILLHTYKNEKNNFFSQTKKDSKQ